MEELTEPQKNFYFNQCWEIEVNNGGISQYFFNTSGRYAHQTVEALKLIGAKKSANILQKAIDKFPNKTVPQDDEQRQEILEQIEEKSDEIWDKLEDKFYEYPEDLNQLNINYITQNKEFFKSNVTSKKTKRKSDTKKPKKVFNRKNYPKRLTMNWEFAKRINPYLEKFDFKKALEIATTELRKLPDSEFHEILNVSIIEQAEEVADWIDEYYQIIVQKNEVQTLYFETDKNEWSTDWCIEGFSYSKDGGLENTDWLYSEYETESRSREGMNSIFDIEQLDKIKTAFEVSCVGEERRKQQKEWTAEYRTVRDWCEQIVCIKFMELIREAHLIAKRKQYLWATIPIYFSECAYDFEFVLKSEN